MSLRDGLDFLEKTPYPCRVSNPGLSIHSVAVVSEYMSIVYLESFMVDYVLCLSVFPLFLSSVFHHPSLLTLAEAEVVASAIRGTDIVSPLCCYYGYKEPASVVLVRRLSGCWRGTDLSFGDSTTSSR